MRFAQNTARTPREGTRVTGEFGENRVVKARATAYCVAGMVRLILFDIDGTLIRAGGAGVKAFVRAFASELNLAEHDR